MRLGGQGAPENWFAVFGEENLSKAAPGHLMGGRLKTEAVFSQLLWELFPFNTAQM